MHQDLIATQRRNKVLLNKATSICLFTVYGTSALKGQCGLNHDRDHMAHRA